MTTDTNDRTIRITVDGGCVTDVENLPDGWTYEINDLDEPGNCLDDVLNGLDPNDVRGLPYVNPAGRVIFADHRYNAR